MALVAGVDTSTQSCTVELRAADTAELVGTGRAPHPRTFPPASEQDPREWWRAFVAAFGAAVADAGASAAEVVAISVAGQCHGLVLLGDDGEPLRPAKLWNDTTSSPQSERIVAELGARQWAEEVGSVPIAAFTITKLAWVAEHEPELLDRVRRVMQPHDYLTWRLTGRTVTDRSEASGTGYFAAHEGRWRVDLLDRFVGRRAWPELLTTVLGPDEPAGTVRADVAAELGLSEDVIVGPGGGDQHLGAAGLGMRPGDVTFSLGTSGVVLTSSEEPVFDPSGIVTGVANAVGGYLPLACTLNATKVTDWAAEMLGVDVATLGEMALVADPAEPVSFAAFLDGERTPNRPHAVGVLAGLTGSTTREDLARGAFEGVLLGLVEALEHIRAVGAPADGPVAVMGGGARSPAYRQLLADLLGREVAVPDTQEATARGAAIQAIAVHGGATVAEVSHALRPAQQSVTAPRRADTDALRERYRAVAGWTGADRAAD